MSVTEQLQAIVRDLQHLPPDKVSEVHDFVSFLRSRYPQGAIDYSDSWTEEDMRDFTAESLRHAESVVPWDDKSDASS